MKTADARVNEDIEALKRDLCRLGADLREVPSRIRGYSRSRIMRSRQRLRDRIMGIEDRAKDHIRGTSAALRDEGHYVADTWRGGIEHRPITSMAIAFAAGVLFASLVERRWH